MFDKGVSSYLHTFKYALILEESMKKLLLTSAALVALVSSAAQAETNVSAGTAAWRPALKISGAASFSSHFHNSDRKHENGGKGRGTHFALEDSVINFDVCGKADSFAGLEYSWKVSVDGDKSKATESNIKDNRLKFKNDYGTFMAGNMNGVEDSGRGAHKIMGAVGGFDGNYKNAINISTGVVATTDMAGRTKRATKITYWTPRLWGIQVGVSYTPDSKALGEGKLRSHTNALTNKSAFNMASFNQSTWSGIIDFSQKLPYGFGINLSLAGLVGKAKAGTQISNQNNTFENARGWAVGGDINYTYGDHIFTVGGEYVDNRKSRMAKGNIALAPGTNLGTFRDGNAGKVWAVAGSYEVGSHKVAYGYFNSRRDLGKWTSPANLDYDLGDAKADVHSVTYDKKMAPGWGLYAEFNHFNFKTTDNAVMVQDTVRAAWNAASTSSNFDYGVKNNKGHSVIVGTKIKF